ncbi:hypothetical protein AA0535_2382 [Asaia krungthepensis NRIC 0535]|uniref:Uncharacterized protein n=1 Tax=Asaia krungthepensis NRIC 0535 TaxID=1307925 RepID=A0ABQ0Q550_9PROT|nr:hypothetical protein AA0535_2382 [Asaia krungthepensis NRIC 0535]
MNGRNDLTRLRGTPPRFFDPEKRVSAPEPRVPIGPNGQKFVITIELECARPDHVTRVGTQISSVGLPNV